jgi:hypothetical protein
LDISIVFEKSDFGEFRGKFNYLVGRGNIATNIIDDYSALLKGLRTAVHGLFKCNLDTGSIPDGFFH